jgi:excinuclease ABC subunit A
MTQDRLIIRGAREHNLKNIDLSIPRDKLVVFTGLSGSGKSSLAFDTIFAEGQRRYVESLSAYARQFLGQMEKPDVDYIEGLSPAISIDQKSTSRNPRSTVGTVTEIHDYLRLLFARVGHPHCPNCGREIAQQTVQQMVDEVLAYPAGSRVMILAPLIRGRKGESRHVFDEARRNGFVRVRVDGQVRDLDEQIDLEKNKKHDIEIVVDRLIIRGPAAEADSSEEAEERRQDVNRLADSLETALKLGSGVVIVATVGAAGREPADRTFSEHFACTVCGINLPEIEPRTFSFNNPHGACPSCTGLGTTMEVDPELVFSNPRLTIAGGAIQPWSRTTSTYYQELLGALSQHTGIPLDVPVSQLTDEQRRIILYGLNGQRIRMRHTNRHGRTYDFETQFEGVVPNLTRRYKETESPTIKQDIEGFMTPLPCPACKGARLKPESLAVTVAGRSIVDVSRLSIREALAFFGALAGGERDERGAGVLAQCPSPLVGREATIARQILKEIRARLGFLVDVGLDYLTLERSAETLSGGEAQRIRLATQIGSSLMGVLYILDEPSIGLHQRDNARLIHTLLNLRDIGNTLIVVEHDEDTMRAADYIVDIGPGAGEHGGHIVAAGTIDEIKAHPDSLTGQYLRGERFIDVPGVRRPGNGKWLEIKGARENNLRHIDVRLPLGTFICVTGVSGSGKSSLITDILYRATAQQLMRARERPGAHDEILGLEHLDKVIDVDQSPIGRTPRSNPATYTGLFTPIRELFASVPEARIRGYQAGRFSFNVKGGRCEACSGEGIIQIEMHFLPDVYVPCEVCKGKRYNREALEIRYHGKNIAEVLEMTVEEALTFFENIPSVANKLRTLSDVGLGYIHLGQPATTLSGGEAQRVKLATELSRRSTGRTLYILDEPTTGLHFADTARLLQVLERLVEGGNSVVVIEHNLDVIKRADWIIDLGPEGGSGGGLVVAEGTPEEVANDPSSHTAPFLRRILGWQEIREMPHVAEAVGAVS